MADQRQSQEVHQEKQPGKRSRMQLLPETENERYRGQGKLEHKVALVTGGDSGIGRAVSILFAQEGADVAIVYLDEHEDAEDTRQRVEHNGGRCLTIAGDVGNPEFCRYAVDKTVETFGKIDILVNNAGEQHSYESILDVTPEQLQRTFATNIFAMFYFVQAALPYMDGGTIINSTSVTAYQGHPQLIPYACTKGAITVLTRSLAISLAEKNIRVNGVAPGPVWTPLIPASFSEEKMARFGDDTLLGRVGQPVEIAPSYLFLACSESSYMTGQVLHPNGGRIVNG